MNDIQAFPHPVPGGQYLAMLRLAHEAEATPIKGKGGNPRFFPTKGAAYEALTEQLLSYMRGNYVRDGEVAGRTAAEVNAMFKVAPQRAKTRVISVVYKRGKARGPKS
ncbi:hypothetical protein J2045_003397 [Peteryoungia aggregata LMG 23059]|uniref:Uncharacterized protein n=1 Tax=Peteryoungia aggregata LMG 23059 TaxID=1368425 RepID=A0ABU0GBM6_9HYPH|nr:hypothetical protein [Peteryoungia aggregata]MDQ0422349.1 hypothetical protein [Peteryoungia aggregata LMG 23059]